MTPIIKKFSTDIKLTYRIILLKERAVALTLAYRPVRAGLLSLYQFLNYLLISFVLRTQLIKLLFERIRYLNSCSTSFFISHIEYSKYSNTYKLFCFYYSIVTIPSMVKEDKHEGNSI